MSSPVTVLARGEVAGIRFYAQNIGSLGQE